MHCNKGLLDARQVREGRIAEVHKTYTSITQEMIELAEEKQFYDLSNMLVKLKNNIFHIDTYQTDSAYKYFCLMCLYQAIMLGNSMLVKALLERGVNVNVQDEYLSTPLHLAASGPDPIIARLLLAAGADVNSKDKNLNTPLQIAVSHNQPRVASCLLQAGANPNVAFNQIYFPDRTLLHIAVQNGNAWMVKVLLQFKANPNVKDANNTTPLHEAVEIASIPIIKDLLAKGAKINAIRRTDNKTPFELTDDPEIRQLLAAQALQQQNYNTIMLQ